MRDRTECPWRRGCCVLQLHSDTHAIPDGDDDDAEDDRRSQSGSTHGDNSRGPADVALTAVGTRFAFHTVGEVSAKRKLVATVAVGTECSVPNVFVDGRSSHRTGRGLSVKNPCLRSK